MKRFLSILCTLAVLLTGVYITPVEANAATKYTVDFISDGSILHSVEVNAGEAIPSSEIPVLVPPVGYWRVENTNTEWDFEQPVTTPLRLVAAYYASVPPVETFEYYYGLTDANDATYTKIFTSGAAASFLQCQPLDALVLASSTNGTTPVTVDSLSDSTTAGVINLPRLKSGYYYTLSGDVIETYGLKITDYIYPFLTWDKDIPKDTEVTLNIYYEAEENLFFTTTLHFNDALVGVSATDPSAGFIDSILTGDETLPTFSGDIYGYPSKLHSNCIITQKSLSVVRANANGDDTHLSATTERLTKRLGVDNSVKFTGYYFEDVTTGVLTVRHDVAYYVYETLDRDIDSTVLIFGNPLSGVTFDNNRNETCVKQTPETTKPVPLSDELFGAYVVVTDDYIELHKILNNELTRDSIENTPGNSARTATITSTGYVDLLDTFNILAAPSISLFELTHYDKFDIKSDSSKIELRYIGEENMSYNVFLTSMGHYGYTPGYGVVKCEAADKVATVNYWGPKSIDSAVNELLFTETVDLRKPTFTFVQNYGNPLYQTSPWYDTAAYTTEVNLTTWASTAKNGDTLDVYCYPVYNGGSYKVQFYNDGTESSSEAVFETRYQPTLPDPGTRVGYLFKNWCVVDTIASTTGTPYNPETFKPTKDGTYIFKTFWDIDGIIKEVKTTKTEYYTGDSIDKSKIIVTVQTDNNGTIKTLKTNEFSIAPTKVEKDGTNQIVVTYNATGATGTITVEGKPVEPVKISAKYKGDDLTVGQAIDEDDIEVNVHYNNGKKEEASLFTFSPTTVRSVGTNTIKVNYGSLSTTCTVRGIAATTQQPSTQKTLQYISATYNGPSPFVGDTLNKSNFSVNAHYSDGSKTIIPSSGFTISPMTVNKEGYNVITINYSGKSCTMSLSARAKSDAGSYTGTGTGSSGNGSGSSTTTTTTGSSSSSNSTTGSNSNGNSEEKKGDPTTGAGVPSGNKGTSSAYLQGSNILDSYSSNTTGANVANNVDILKELKSVGTSATETTITLYNGAMDNYITPEMLKVLKSKGLTLKINMLDPTNKTDIIGVWEITGKVLDNTDYTHNPNIAFETKDKGSETVTFVSVNPTDYPKGFEVTVRPSVSSYDEGKLVRVYSVNNTGSNAKLLSTFKWGEDNSHIPLDIYESKYYAISDSSQVYMDGANVLETQAPSVSDVVSTVTSTEDSFEWEDDSSEVEEEFDWGDFDEPTVSPNEPVGKKFPIGIVIAVVSLLLVGGGFAAFLLLRNKSAVQTRQLFGNEDLEDDSEYSTEDDEGLDFGTEDDDDIV